MKYSAMIIIVTCSRGHSVLAHSHAVPEDIHNLCWQAFQLVSWLDRWTKLSSLSGLFVVCVRYRSASAKIQAPSFLNTQCTLVRQSVSSRENLATYILDVVDHAK